MQADTQTRAHGACKLVDCAVLTLACNSCCSVLEPSTSCLFPAIAQSAAGAGSQAVSAGIPAGTDRVCVCQGGSSQEGRF